MRLFALALAAAAYSVLAVTLASVFGHWAAPLSALGVGAAWLALLLWRPRTAAHSLFVVIATLGAAVALAGGSGLSALAAAAIALLAWDAAGASSVAAPLSSRDRARIARHYLPQATLLGLASLAVAAFSRTVSVRLTFVAAIALSFVILACLAASLWQSGRFRRSPRDEAPDDPKEERGTRGRQ